MSKWFLALALLLPACAATNTAGPQIEVSPEAAARSCMIHACGKTPAEPEAAPAERPDGPAYARAAAADGRVDPSADVELGNPEIRVRLRAQVGAPLELVSVGDAAGTPKGPRIALVSLVVADGAPVAMITDRVSMFTGEDGSATVTVFGHAASAPQLHATTTLKLAKGDRAFLLSSTLENTGAAPTDAVDVQDRVMFSGMRPFVPGATRASTSADAREFTGPYVGAIGEADSVAFTSTEGEVKATVDKEQAHLVLARGLSLGARSQRSFDRVVVVGSRADSSSVVAELLRASGIATGTVRVNLGERGGADKVTLPQELVVRTGGADVLTVRMPSASFDVELPEGAFTVRSRGQPETAGVPVAIHAGLVANIAVPLAR